MHMMMKLYICKQATLYYLFASSELVQVNYNCIQIRLYIAGLQLEHPFALCS